MKSFTQHKDNGRGEIAGCRCDKCIPNTTQDMKDRARERFYRSEVAHSAQNRNEEIADFWLNEIDSLIERTVKKTEERIAKEDKSVNPRHRVIVNRLQGYIRVLEKSKDRTKADSLFILKEIIK